MLFISAGHNKDAQGASYKDVTEFILAEKWADSDHVATANTKLDTRHQQV